MAMMAFRSLKRKKMRQRTLLKMRMRLRMLMTSGKIVVSRNNEEDGVSMF
jgi:hypothetical protein